MSSRYRFDFAPASAEAGCSACGAVFIDAAAFDVHRGIRPQGRRGDEAQDLGRCMSPAEMRKARLDQDRNGRWGDKAALARVEKMRGIREARHAAPTDLLR